MSSFNSMAYFKSNLFQFVLQQCNKFTFIQNIKRSNENKIKMGDDEKIEEEAGRNLLRFLNNILIENKVP